MHAYASATVMGALGKTLLGITATANARPHVAQVIVGCPDTPNDLASLFAIRRYTGGGSGALVTVFPRDPADGNPVCTAMSFTVEPSYVSGYYVELPLNQRASMIWNAQIDAEICSALGAGNGIGVQLVSGPLVNYSVTIEFWE